jgi:hypothetical protein
MAQTMQVRLHELMNAYLSALRASPGMDTREFFSPGHKFDVVDKSLFYL